MGVEIDRDRLPRVQCSLIERHGVRIIHHPGQAAVSTGMVLQMDTAVLLAGLDPDQRHAVTTDSRLVAVIAGAGSGKTRVLTRRLAYRVATGTAEASHSLVLTFTREAAGELRRRLPSLGLRDRVEAGTFHSVMLAVLRQFWSDRNQAPPTVISDRRRLLVDVLGTTAVDEALAEIDWATARGITPERYDSAARAAGRRADTSGRIAETYRGYIDLKRRRGVIDLDDVLQRSIDLLEGDREMADVIAWRFRHLLVDEAQDLNPLQHRLIDLLRRGHDDLFLVGDPLQAIYAFNGADPSLLLDVGERFGGVEIIRLATNHRSTTAVVEAGRHIVTTAGMTPTTERATTVDGPAVAILSADDEDAEAAAVVRWIQRLDPEIVRRQQVAVLARTHAQLQRITAALDANGIGRYERIDAPGSPYRAPLDTAVRQRSAPDLRRWAHDLLEELDTTDPPGPAAVEVANAVFDYLREQPLGDGMGFRTWVATSDPFGRRERTGVELLTFHGSKGREWQAVAVTGVETGLVPHRSASTAAARAEEARLLYVAVTRATRDLLITWAQRRGGYRRKPSPLLEGYAPAPSAPAQAPASITEFVARARSPRQSSYEALRDWRTVTARGAGILPEQLCSDQMLRIIEDHRPATPEALAELTGTGILTARRWYGGIAAALDNAQSSISTTTGA